MVRVNLSNVPDSEPFTAIPAGKYNLRLEKWSEQTAATGNSFIGCEFFVDGGEYGGRKIWDKFFLTEASWWKLKQFARAIDFARTDNANGFELEDLFKAAIKADKLITAHIIVEPYTDKKGVDRESNKVDSYQSAEAQPDDLTF